jgi:hypothetical protein
MNHIDYDPQLHAGLPLFAIEDGPRVDGELIPMIFRRVTDPAEIEAAALVPWFYVVEAAETENAAEASHGD